MDIVKIVSGFLSASNEDVDEATLVEFRNGKSPRECPAASFEPRMRLGSHLFKTPFRYSYAELRSAVRETGRLNPFVNVEPPASRTDGKLVWDYAPRMELDFGGLCSGEEEAIRNAIRFVDDRGLVTESDFAGERGIGSFREDSNGSHIWLLPNEEQKRLLRVVAEGDDLAGMDVGWTIVRFSFAILSALARQGFIARDYKWFKEKEEAKSDDEVFEAVLES